MEEKDPREWTKRERLCFLLDHWSEIFDPNAAAGMAASGDGDGVPLMPLMAHDRSVVELAGCLGNLAAEHPAAYRHLKAYRCNAEWRQVRAKVRVKLQSGRWDEIPGWKRERLIPRWINPLLVWRAEEFLEREFRGEVFIPQDLWKGLTEAGGA